MIPYIIWQRERNIEKGIAAIDKTDLDVKMLYTAILVGLEILRLDINTGS